MLKLSELIIHQTEDFIAINKPAGLLTIPDRMGTEVSLKQMLIEKFGQIFTVHRLDKETSGVVVFALNEATHKLLSLQFSREGAAAGNALEKIYFGLVLGKPADSEGVINEPIAEHPVKKGLMTVQKKGKESITEYKLIDSFRFYSWMEFKILTGRTHQIRVHMKHLGHPIVCDPLYGDGKGILLSQIKSRYNLSKEQEEERPLLNRLALHAAQLKFTGPGNVAYNLEAPLPKDLRATLNQLQKHTKK